MKSRRLVGVLGVIGILFFGVGVAFAQQTDDVGTNFNVRQAEPAAGVRTPLPPTGAVIYSNGPLITHPGGGAGGLDASAVQTALGLTLYGSNVSLSAVARIADDFTVPAGATWRIEQAAFFAYQTGATTPNPTINHVNVRIWNGPPNNPASQVIFGDTTTNRLVSSVWSNIYRVLDTGLLVTNRPIFRNTATIGTTLTAGTYWIDWQIGGTLASGPWQPPISILGQTNTGNAMQFFSGVWNPMQDGTRPQGAPFQLIGPDIEAAALVVDGGGNNVLDPGEPAIVAPSWRNPSPVAQTNVTGTLSNFVGPAGGTYTINDSTASYGDIPAGATAPCTDCYGVTATATTRPATHWDATADETLNLGATKTWTLHIGGGFTDVTTTSPFYRFIETLLHSGVTGGCGADTYCPVASTTREQMAVFVLVAKEGAGYTPPACVSPNYFGDVPETSPFCRFIEELANRLVVSGCAPNRYCPSDPVTREQMAIFALRTLDGTINPPACVAGSEMFTDVPSTSPFCRWVEELARRGVVSGCAPNLYCPSDPVTREQMGVFLSVTFGLALYGV